MEIKTNKVIYFGDPMCSWCYGFTPHISKVKDGLNKAISFQLVMGGLRPGGTETMAELSEFLRHHWDEVRNRSGQPFSYDILGRADFKYDTEPACRAVVAARRMDDNIEFDFFKEVQKAFYVHGKNTNDPDTYLAIADNLGLNKNEYLQCFTDPVTIHETEQDFSYSQGLGIRGFPTTIMHFNNQYFLLAGGYTDSESLNKRISEVMRH